MKEHHPCIGLGRLCRLFGASRQAYYQSLDRTNEQHIKEAIILTMVKELRIILKRCGSVKIHHALKEELSTHQIYIGRDRFHNLLKDNDLLVKPRKKYYVRTTNSNHHYRRWPDLTGGFKPAAPHQLWVSDITYIRTREGFLYLSLITDAFSSKTVGYHLSHSLSAKGCIRALNKAIAQLPAGQINLIHHSDRGIQYCCDQYVSVLQKRGIAISMTQSGSPYENAKAERVNGILKSEFELDLTFEDYNAATAAVSRSLSIYNHIRPHYSCQLRTPEQMHQPTAINVPPYKP